MKIFAKVLLMLFMIIIFINQIGCQSNMVSNKDERNLNITMAGGSPNGTLYMVLSGVAECVQKCYPGSVVMIVPGSGTANLFRINNNEVDAGASHSATAYSALKGEELFDSKLDNISAIASLYPSTLQIVVNKNLGIESFDQIINNKMKLQISVDQPGSTASITFQRLLAEYGVDSDDFAEWGGEIIYKNMNDSADMLVDGRIEGMSISTLFPAPTILEASLNRELTILEINPNILESMINKYHYNTTVIPAHSYPFLEKDILALSSNTIIVVPRNSSEDMAYLLARSITENIDYLKDVHVALKQITPQSLTENLGIPLHKGAERYYREIGIIK